MTTATRPEGFSLSAFGKRLGLAIVTTLASVLLLAGAGVPETFERAITFGAAMTVAFVGSYPPETPQRWRKNAVAWGAHLVFFTGGMLLVSWWRGA